VRLVAISIENLDTHLLACGALEESKHHAWS
jgi:hypothetical protein